MANLSSLTGSRHCLRLSNWIPIAQKYLKTTIETQNISVDNQTNFECGFSCEKLTLVNE